LFLNQEIAQASHLCIETASVDKQDLNTKTWISNSKLIMDPHVRSTIVPLAQ